MKVQSVRFGARQWDLITEAAALEGTSAAQFIRDAAFARAVLHLRDHRALGWWIELAAILQDNPEISQRLEFFLSTPPSSESPAQP